MIKEKIEKINSFILKNMLILIVVIGILCLFILSRRGAIDVTPRYAMETTSYSAPRVMKAMAFNNDSSANESKVVKTFALSIEVKDTESTKNKVEKGLNEVGGKVDSFYSYDSGNNNLAYNYSLKIPANKIEDAIAYFKSLGVIKSENSSSMDLTEQYSDNENRLKNLYSRRDRLREMMSSKTQNLGDIVSVDRELSNVQYDIENLEKANKTIDGNVNYFKLDLSILPEIKIDNFNNSEWRVKNSWKKAVNTVIVFGQKTVDFGFTVVVFLPIIFVGLIILTFFAKFFNTNK